MPSPFLSVRNLQAGYGRAQVLFDVSFDIQPGEVVTLLGRNGMGRSTTIKCLFGMLPLTSGSIASADGGPTACRRTGSRAAASRSCPRGGRSSRR